MSACSIPSVGKQLEAYLSCAPYPATLEMSQNSCSILDKSPQPTILPSNDNASYPNNMSPINLFSVTADNSWIIIEIA